MFMFKKFLVFLLLLNVVACTTIKLPQTTTPIVEEVFEPYDSIEVETLAAFVLFDALFEDLVLFPECEHLFFALDKI